MSLDFSNCCLLEFHRLFKRELHAANYGNYAAKLFFKDFQAAYAMGGEL